MSDGSSRLIVTRIRLASASAESQPRRRSPRPMPKQANTGSTAVNTVRNSFTGGMKTFFRRRINHNLRAKKTPERSRPDGGELRLKYRSHFLFAEAVSIFIKNGTVWQDCHGQNVIIHRQRIFKRSLAI